MSSLIVSEVFGPTLQGEGPHLGRRVGFVRLGTCNLHCAWCDTGYTWDRRHYDLAAELERRPVPDLLAEVTGMDVDRVVITGGEPLLQDRPAIGLVELASGLYERGVAVDVETNGTRGPSDDLTRVVDLFVVSPKLEHAASGMTSFDALDHFPSPSTVLKVVCLTAEDVEATAKLASLHGIPRFATWVMPEGTDAETLAARLAVLAPAALAAGVNLTPRFHIDLWGNRRGR